MSRRIVPLQSPSDVAQARIRTCAQCGVEFEKDPRNTWKYWAKAKYCSSRCAGDANSERSDIARPTLREAWERRVIRKGGCWGWSGPADAQGYPLLPYNRKMLRATRVALELFGRPPAASEYACHTCDNPSCVNPHHLYPGSPSDNMRDARSRGRTQRGSGHYASKLTEQDVRLIRASDEPSRVLAAQFGVCASNITMIRNRRTWKHVK